MKDEEKIAVMSAITRLESLQEVISGYPNREDPDGDRYVIDGDSGLNPDWFEAYIESTKNILEDLLA